MDEALAGYVRALRAAGAEASTAETIDAARAIALLGYADREDLKAALGVVLAKSAEEKQLHDEVFERYFGAPVPGHAAPRERRGDDSADAGSAPAGGDDALSGGVPSGSGDGAPNSAPIRPPEAAVEALVALAGAARRDSGSGEAAALQMALARAAKAVGVDNIRFATQAPYLTQRMMQEMGAAALDARLLDMLGRHSPAARAEADRLRSARNALQRAARAFIDQRFELFGRPATEAFMTEVSVKRPIGRMSPVDMERMKTAVARMARKLAARHARRQRVQLRGQLDMRRTLRANAAHDGVPFTLRWRHRRRDKPRIVAVCDVSGSVATQVRFLLLFLYALHDAVGDLRTFAFSGRLKDVAPPLESLPFDDAMALILKEVGNGSTDYGQALTDLHDHHPDCVDRRTTLIVLGDGRSNGTDPRLDLFAELADRAKRVLWLCPEPPMRWGTGDSVIPRYQPFCTHLTWCSTATDLERVLDEALGAYS